jgi:hypothetical protein
MQSLGVEPSLPVQGTAVRFSILPSTAAAISANYRAIVPVVHYRNAKPFGKYEKQPGRPLHRSSANSRTGLEHSENRCILGNGARPTGRSQIPLPARKRRAERRAR